MPKVRKAEQTELMRRLENRVANLEAKNRKISQEAVERGKEITKMIRIFLTLEHLLPEEQKEEFREVAVGYAARCDLGRGECYCKDKIDFRA